MYFISHIDSSYLFRDWDHNKYRRVDCMLTQNIVCVCVCACVCVCVQMGRKASDICSG